MAAYAPDTYTASPAQTDFSITFDYISPAHVKLTIDGSPSTAFSIVAGPVLRLDTPATGGEAIVIFRETPIATRVVDFEDGGAITETDLDNAFNQIFYSLEETILNALVGMGKAGGHWDADSLKITNLAAPALDTDAATKGSIQPQVDAAAASAAAALVSENNAATSETNAAASESNAGTSETNAAASEVAAEAARDALLGFGKRPMRGYHFKRNVTNPTYQLDIAAGVCVSQNTDGGEYQTLTYAGGTAAIDFTVSGVGGLGPTVSRTVSTWYHIFAILPTGGGTVALYADTTLAGSNVPAGYTAKRRIGCVYLNSNGLGEMSPFGQRLTAEGRVFMWQGDRRNHSPLFGTTTAYTGAGIETLTVRLPTGAVFGAIGSMGCDEGYATPRQLWPLYEANSDGEALTNDATPGVAWDVGSNLNSPPAAQRYMLPEMLVWSNTSGQIQFNLIGSLASGEFKYVQTGYVDLLED